MLAYFYIIFDLISTAVYCLHMWQAAHSHFSSRCGPKREFQLCEHGWQDGCGFCQKATWTKEAQVMKKESVEPRSQKRWRVQRQSCRCQWKLQRWLARMPPSWSWRIWRRPWKWCSQWRRWRRWRRWKWLSMTWPSFILVKFGLHLICDTWLHHEFLGITLDQWQYNTVKYLYIFVHICTYLYIVVHICNSHI